MADQESIIPWTGAGWPGEVHAWIGAQLARRGLELLGPTEQLHAYPWSTVLRVPATGGTLFFKAVSPLEPHEPAVLELLSRLRPDCTPELLAVDAARGWVLMRDGGAMLRTIVRPNRDLRPWLAVLPLYAELQIELVAHVPELLSLGAPDRRLAALATLYQPLLSDRESLRIDQPDGLTSAQEQRLHALTPRVAELCRQLAEHGIPETLNHGDLTDGNILTGDGRTMFIDWGDSCISHPFFSLRTALVSAEISLGLEDNAPELLPMREAYLEPWTRYATRAELNAALDLALRLAAINGALTWHNLVSRLEGQAREDYAVPVPALLDEFLAAETAAGQKSSAAD